MAAKKVSKIAQFRFNESKIDIYVAQLAKAIHGDVAAETEYHGEIGHEADPRLDVYTIQKLLRPSAILHLSRPAQEDGSHPSSTLQP